ncbi:hypothetical protein CDD81_1384 [Ophiocordyceps australis]|uniref:Uncharacterized protein n=1 Tax=Ophiocordyceps australis TaxID=1399860 RepID=A0A2C5XZ17_9HYPO|nr:hypothetical protein CDD81_1384 [Ophiocordyceps australis]
MRLSLAAALTALAVPCAADSLEVWYEYWGHKVEKHAKFKTSYGSYNVPVDRGCTPTDVPGMEEFCVDWANKRAHFRFSHQNHKRCLIQKTPDRPNYSCFGGHKCNDWRFDEVPCTW